MALLGLAVVLSFVLVLPLCVAVVDAVRAGSVRVWYRS